MFFAFLSFFLDGKKWSATWKHTCGETNASITKKVLISQTPLLMNCWELVSSIFNCYIKLVNLNLMADKKSLVRQPFSAQRQKQAYIGETCSTRSCIEIYLSRDFMPKYPKYVSNVKGISWVSPFTNKILTDRTAWMQLFEVSNVVMRAFWEHSTHRWGGINLVDGFLQHYIMECEGGSCAPPLLYIS